MKSPNKTKGTEYKIRVVSRKDYKDIVPHKDLVDKTFGFANPKDNTAVIIDSGNEKLNQQHIEHELEELLSSTSPHEVDGIRYGFFSKIGDWFKKTFIPESPTGIGAGLGTLAGMALAPFTGGTSLAFLNPATLGTLGGGIGGYQEGGDLKSTLLGGLQGFGAGSLGTGLSAMAGPATGLSGNLGEFATGVLSPTKDVLGWLGLGGTAGAGGGLTLPGFGEGGMFAGGATGGAGGGLNAFGIPSVGGTLSNAPMTAMADILGGGAIPGGNLMAGGGASSGGLLSSLLGGGGSTNWLAKLLPTLLMGGAYLGQEAPEMPAFQPAPEVGMASQTYQDLLGQIQSQDFMAPIQDYLDLQQEQDMRDLRTQAASQGWLDSSMFAERQADIGRQYGVAGGLSMADLAKWGIGESGDIAGQLGNIGQYLTGAPYQAEMGRYTTEEASRQALLQSIFSQLGNVFNPNPMDEYLRRILAG